MFPFFYYAKIPAHDRRKLIASDRQGSDASPFIFRVLVSELALFHAAQIGVVELRGPS